MNNSESELSDRTREYNSNKNVYGMSAYGGRESAINEVHARPHILLASPQTLLHFSFMTKGDKSGDQKLMAELSQHGSIYSPEDAGFQHNITWREDSLYCEKHGEFSTYLWSTSYHLEIGKNIENNPFKQGFTPPGPVISGTRVDIIPWTEEAEEKVAEFDPISLCFSLVENGDAAIVTDFRQDDEGLTRILILERGLKAAQLGALAQRVLDIESYRTLALLSIPMVRRLTLELGSIENRLSSITGDMSSDENRNNELLLSKLTQLAAELEAGAVANLYRFGASQAYYEILEERLTTLSENGVSGYYTWADFLQRRIAPAMRTCRSVKERQAKLSDKLVRSISLLRSWIDIELEHQNRDLLTSMNDRAKQQLHLQQTVEGLSVAAISYYIISLISYLIKGIPGIHEVIQPELAVTMLVPVIVLAIWWVVRKIRNSNSEAES